MYQSDWILRQIEMMGLAFRRLADALRERRPEEALEVSREAVGELLDGDPSLIDHMTGEGLVALLSAGGALDAFKAHVLAELLVARSNAYAELGRRDAAEWERRRAQVLLRALLPEAKGAERERVLELAAWLETDGPPVG